MSRTWELYNAGDLDAAFEIFDPEVEVYSSPELANRGTYPSFDEALAVAREREGIEEG